MPKNIVELANALDVSPAMLAFGDERVDSFSEKTVELAILIESMPDNKKDALHTLIASLKDNK